MRSEAGAAPPPVLYPNWRAPRHVGSAMSLRAGGLGKPPWDTQNMGLSVGDAPEAVRQNRERWADLLQARPVWLRQVHGSRVLELTASNAALADQQSADAAWTCTPGLACTVMVADCLPVLLACREGRAVAAAHAGWRGLAAGVVQATVRALCDGSGATPEGLTAWLGPCIGPGAFEVGADVFQAFTTAATDAPLGLGPQLARHFVFRARADGSARWLADLQGLAQDLLLAAGVRDFSVEAACTVQDSSRFFSFRRSGVTGRHAVSIWLR